MQTLQTACKCRRLPVMARLNAAVMPPKEMPIMLFAAAVMGVVSVVLMFSIL